MGGIIPRTRKFQKSLCFIYLITAAKSPGFFIFFSFLPPPPPLGEKTLHMYDVVHTYNTENNVFVRELSLLFVLHIFGPYPFSALFTPKLLDSFPLLRTKPSILYRPSKTRGEGKQNHLFCTHSLIGLTSVQPAAHFLLSNSYHQNYVLLRELY